MYQKKIANFDKTIAEAYWAFEKSGTSLLQAIALYLGLKENHFDSLNPKLYEDITAGEYLDERLREIGLKS